MKFIKSIEDLTSALKKWKEIEEHIDNYVTSVWLDDKLNSKAQKLLKSAGYHTFPVKVIKDKLYRKLNELIDDFPKDKIPELFELAKKYHEPYLDSFWERKFEDPGVPLIDVSLRGYHNYMTLRFKYGEDKYEEAYISKFKGFYKEFLDEFIY